MRFSNLVAAFAGLAVFVAAQEAVSFSRFPVFEQFLTPSIRSFLDVFPNASIALTRSLLSVPVSRIKTP